MRRIIKKSISVLMSFTVFAAALPAMAEKSGTAELISVTTEGIKLDAKNKITSAACYKSLSDAWNQNNAVIDCTVNDGNEISFGTEIGNAVDWDKAFYIRLDTEGGEPIYKKLVYKKLFSEDFESYNGNYELSDIIPELKNMSDRYHKYGIWKDDVWPDSHTMRSSMNDFMLKILPSKDYENLTAEYSIKNTSLGEKSEGNVTYKDIIGFVIGYTDGSTINSYKAGHPAYTGTASGGWISDDIGYVEMGFDMDADIYIGARKSNGKAYGEERKSTAEKGLTAEDTVGIHRIKMSRCNDYINFYWTQSDKEISDSISMDMTGYAIKDNSYVTIAAMPGGGYNDGALDDLLLYTWDDMQKELDSEIDNIVNGDKIIITNVEELKKKYSSATEITLYEEDKISSTLAIYEALPDEMKAGIKEEYIQYLNDAESRIGEIKSATQAAGFELLRRTPAGYIYSFSNKVDIDNVSVNLIACTDFKAYDSNDKHYICIPEKYITDTKNIISVNNDIQILADNSEKVNDESIALISNDPTISVDNGTKTISGVVYGESFEALADKLTMPADCELSKEENESFVIKKIFEDDKKQEYTVVYNHYITVKAPYVLDDTDKFTVSGIPFGEKLADFAKSINHSEKIHIAINGHILTNASGTVRDKDILSVYIKGEDEPKQTFTLITASRPSDLEITSDVYGIANNVISGVKKGTSYEEFVKDFECKNGTLAVFDSKMQEKNFGTMDGGETVRLFAHYPKLDNVYKAYNICYDEELYNDIITNRDNNNFSISGSDIQKTTTEYPGYEGKPSMLWSDDGKIEFRSNPYDNKCTVSVEAYTARSFNGLQCEYSIYVGDKLVGNKIKVNNTEYQTNPQFVKLTDVEVDKGEIIRVCSKSKGTPFSAVRFSDNRAAYVSSINIDENEIIGSFSEGIAYNSASPFSAQISFAANMDSNTVNGENIRLISENGYKLNGSVTYDDQSNAYTFAANEKLKSGVNYYLQISTDVKTSGGFGLVRCYTVPVGTESKANHAYAKSIYSDNSGYAEYSVELSDKCDKNLNILFVSFDTGFSILYNKKISEIPSLDNIGIKAEKDNDKLKNIKIFIVDQNYKLYDIVEIEEDSE